MNQSILIVDDNQDAADAMAKLLQYAGYTVHIAYSGLEALTAVQSKRPRVCLLDIRMPGLDGYEIARRLRADATLSELVLIALTGFGQDEDKSAAQEAGFNHHMTKPASLQDILSLLNRYDIPKAVQ